MFGVLRRLLGELSLFFSCTREKFGFELKADLGQIWYHSMTLNNGDEFRGQGVRSFHSYCSMAIFKREHPIQPLKVISRCNETIRFLDPLTHDAQTASSVPADGSMKNIRFFPFFFPYLIDCSKAAPS